MNEPFFIGTEALGSPLNLHPRFTWEALGRGMPGFIVQGRVFCGDSVKEFGRCIRAQPHTCMQFGPIVTTRLGSSVAGGRSILFFTLMERIGRSQGVFPNAWMQSAEVRPMTSGL